MEIGIDGKAMEIAIDVETLDFVRALNHTTATVCSRCGICVR